MSGLKIKRMLKSKEMILVVITLAVIAIFTVNNRYFVSAGSLRGTLQSMSVAGIMTIGMACIFIGGGIDLSGGGLHLFAGIVCASLIRFGIPWAFAIILSLIAGFIIGAINAFLVAKLNMMPFIATIAVSNVLVGLNLALTDAQNVPVAVESFYWGSEALFGIFSYPFIIMVALLLVYGLILSKTQFGRNIYLVGGNQAAARLAGVNPVRTRSILFINNGVLSALAGIVQASYMHTAIAQQQSDAQMTAITAAVLGGIAFTGGAGGMTGCFIGIVLLNFFNAGISSLAGDAYLKLMAQGILLIIALAVDFVNERSRERSLKGLAKSALNAKREAGI